VDQATVLSKMKAFFVDKDPPETLERFEELKATDLLTESIDVIEFLMYLEDELRAKIDANQIGPALANMTFGDLATKLCHAINEEEPGQP
jgi:acyl carrier protein